MGGPDQKVGGPKKKFSALRADYFYGPLTFKNVPLPLLDRFGSVLFYSFSLTTRDMDIAHRLSFAAVSFHNTEVFLVPNVVFAVLSSSALAAQRGEQES